MAINQNETVSGCKLVKGSWETKGNPMAKKLAELLGARIITIHDPAQRYVWSFRSTNVHIYVAEETEKDAQYRYAEKIFNELLRKDLKEWERRVLRLEVQKYGDVECRE